MIPSLTTAGLLPPFVGKSSADQRGISPYASDLLEIAQRFATSSSREALFRGLLAWRAALVGIGMSGIQWLDGSFLEDIEHTENREPRDIDVVTFMGRPPGARDPVAWTTFVRANQQLFANAAVKNNYQCDAYFVDVTLGPAYLLPQTTYWYGLFTHRRATHDWKGIIAVALPSNDADALAFLNAQGAQP